jgi:hypothetical protein
MKRQRADYIADAIRQKVDANRQRAVNATEQDDRERRIIQTMNATLKERQQQCETKLT